MTWSYFGSWMSQRTLFDLPSIAVWFLWLACRISLVFLAARPYFAFWFGATDFVWSVFRDGIGVWFSWLYWPFGWCVHRLGLAQHISLFHQPLGSLLLDPKVTRCSPITAYNLVSLLDLKMVIIQRLAFGIRPLIIVQELINCYYLTREKIQAYGLVSPVVAVLAIRLAVGTLLASCYTYASATSRGHLIGTPQYRDNYVNSQALRLHLS